MTSFAATYFDGTTWREGVLALEEGRPVVHDETPDASLPRFPHAIVGGFTDHHVHLMLVDPSPLTSSRLGRVLDLGAPFARLREWAPKLPVQIDFAGAFLTPPGGYPSDRWWAREGSVREIADADAAALAVAEMADAGASCIKVMSNSEAGPVFDDAVFAGIVASAAEHGIPVYAHAEGPGEAERAVRLGATGLVHTPFTERLDDGEIARQAASAAWITTLAIHEGEPLAIAIDNLRRFAAVGGTVLYGTDMGNGPTPIDLRAEEVEAMRAAGIDGAALIATLAPVDPRTPGAVLLRVPQPAAGVFDPLTAAPLAPTDLVTALTVELP